MFAVIEHHCDCFEWQFYSLCRPVILEACHPHGVKFAVPVPVDPSVYLWIELGVVVNINPGIWNLWGNVTFRKACFEVG